MCRDGIDLVSLKVALKHSADRLEQEVGHLRQWSALANNVNLAELSTRLQDALERVAAGEEMVGACVRALAELQVQGPTPGSTGVTINPL